MKKYDKPQATVLTITTPCLLHSVSGEVDGPVGAPFMETPSIFDIVEDIENM